MNRNIYFISLGCDKNLVDSEVMLGLLGENGYSFTDSIDDAQIVVVNTCCFIGDAKEESVNTILEVADYKTNGQVEKIIVTGCLAQRYKDEIINEIPEVDAVIGTASIEEIVNVIGSAYEGNVASVYKPLDTPPYQAKKRINSSCQSFGYLKIAEGCNKHCTYCIIPSLRGPYRSLPIEHLVGEARQLAATGVTELILVAQETTIYGTDLYGKKSLPELVRELAKIEDIHWIRILYCYPEEIDDELIELIATEPKVVHYLDLPIQHSSDAVLKKMGRLTDEEGLRRVINKLRNRIPDIALRTTLISGFPGETEEDFESLYRFVNEIEFDRLGVFPYSLEEDTPAASFDNQVPDEVKLFRRDELMELQQAIVFDKAETLVGNVYEVMIEGSIPEERVYVGRTFRDAPDVDGYVFMPYDRERMSGDYCMVRITGTKEYDLIGEIIDEFAE